ncbi:MAG: hypothetical protein KDC98_01130 [Planctomycetes bacterium]|nr:hypothetical protein [Planctomycetota bacterium]
MPRPSVCCVFRFACLSLMTAVAIEGQDRGAEAKPAAERGRVFGIARLADRSPWADAKGLLVSQPFAGCRDRDLIEFTANAAGRFAADIIVGRVYTAWAWSADGDRWRVSQVVADVVPHLPLVLGEQRHEPRVSLRLTGLASWRDPGPVKLWCAGVDDAGMALPIGEPVEGGVVELPPMGTGRRWVFLTAGNGLDLFRLAIPGTASGELEVVVPSPVEVPIEVREPSGKAVKDARVFVRSPAGAYLPGTTDEQGRLLAKVPEPRTPSVGESLYLPLWGEAPDHLVGRLWRSKAAPSGPWAIYLQPTAPTRFRLLWGEGDPVAGAPAHVSGVEQSIEPGGMRNGVPIGRPNGQFANDGHLVTDAEGGLAIAYDPKYPIAIGMLLPGERRAALAARLGATPSQLALVWAGKVEPGQAVEARVDRLVPIRCRIRCPDGSPAQRAHVRLAAGENPGIGLGYVADQRGEVVVLVPATDELLIAASLDARGDVFRIAVPEGSAPGEVAELVLDLPESTVLRGRVIDGKGEPLAGTEVVLDQSLQGPRGAWQSLDGVGDGVRVVAHGYLYPAMARPMFQQAARTDDEGRFEYRVPGLAFPMSVSVEGYLSFDLGKLTSEEAAAGVELVVR